jgi:hypothetical protein
MLFTDWSPDGKFMTFIAGVLAVVPLAGDQKPTERKAIEWMREEYNLLTGRFSPDMRYMAYLSDQAENGKLELYVRPFDAAKPEGPPPGTIVQVSKDASGMLGWRADGRELYFLAPDPQNADAHVMAVDVTAVRRSRWELRSSCSNSPALLVEIPFSGRAPATTGRSLSSP